MIQSYGTKTEGGVLTKFKSLIGIGRISGSVAKAAGYRLYESIDVQVNYEDFCQGLNLPDTFHSWFIIRSLHVWMLMARLMQEGDDGRVIRNAVVEALWEDVDVRAKQLGDTAASVRRKQIQLLVDEFQASLFSYDEGLHSSDQVLAGAIWRHILGQQDFNPRSLDIMVDYVRENIASLDKTNKEDLCIKRKLNWAKPKF